MLTLARGRCRVCCVCVIFLQNCASDWCVELAATHSRLNIPLATKDVPLLLVDLMACIFIAAPYSPVATNLPAIPIPLVQHSVKDLSVFSMLLMW